MKGILASLSLLACTCGAFASWYWPFGSDDSDAAEMPRLSELLEPVSVLIDEGSDLAADGKVQEAVAKYREALTALDDVESQNPDRVSRPEFATVRNKRAYLNAAIDALLMSEAHGHAKPVAVSDTTALEKRLAEEKAAATKQTPGAAKAVTNAAAKVTNAAAKAGAAKAGAAKGRLSRREQILSDMAAGDWAAAKVGISEMLAADPANVTGLNLSATLSAMQGDFVAAEKTLDLAIEKHPRSHFAYYNMALLLLRMDAANVSGARRYYETGRTFGGPADEELEALLK